MTAEGAGAEAAAEAARTATLATGTTAEEAASEHAVVTLAGSPSGSKAADGPGIEVEIAPVAVTMSTGTATAVDTAGGPVRPGAPDGIPTDAGGLRMRSGPAKARCIPLRKCR